MPLFGRTSFGHLASGVLACNRLGLAEIMRNAIRFTAFLCEFYAFLCHLLPKDRSRSQHVLTSILPHIFGDHHGAEGAHEAPQSGIGVFWHPLEGSGKIAASRLLSFGFALRQI